MLNIIFLILFLGGVQYLQADGRERSTLTLWLHPFPSIWDREISLAFPQQREDGFHKLQCSKELFLFLCLLHDKKKNHDLSSIFPEN